MFLMLLISRKHLHKNEPVKKCEPVQPCQCVKSSEYVNLKLNQTCYLKDNMILESDIYPSYENNREILPIPILI